MAFEGTKGLVNVIKGLWNFGHGTTFKNAAINAANRQAAIDYENEQAKAHEQRVKDVQERKATEENIPVSGIEKAPTVNQDTTNGAFDIAGWQNWATKMRDEQWAREDAIRAETQAREDTAYERSIASLRRSGVNINLLGNISPAESGGGITNATGIDTSTLTESMSAEKEKILQEAQAIIDKGLQELQQAFEKGENTKDRISDIVNTIIGAVGNIIGTSIFAKSNLLGKMIK